jgi:hypothetical protein
MCIGYYAVNTGVSSRPSSISIVMAQLTISVAQAEAARARAAGEHWRQRQSGGESWDARAFAIPARHFTAERLANQSKNTAAAMRYAAAASFTRSQRSYCCSHYDGMAATSYVELKRDDMMNQKAVPSPQSSSSPVLIR